MARSRRPLHQDVEKSALRLWEDEQRDRFSADRLVRTTHAVDCGGGCEMEVGVRRGRIVFERPAVRAPGGLNAGEPRCCTPGLCAASYVDDPSRVLFPLVRESLIEAWLQARNQYQDPVRAWASIVEDSPALRHWKQARGYGGFRRTDWQTAEELVAASLVYTVKESGPDRIFGIPPSPASALISAAAGLRFLHLLGGVQLDLTDESDGFGRMLEAIWGEKADAPEAAAWAEAEMIVVLGMDAFSALSADASQLLLARRRGARLWALTDVQDGTTARSDRWLPLAPEKLSAFWAGVNHLLLRRYFTGDGPGPFDDYIRRYSDAPLLVGLRKSGANWVPAGLVQASESGSDRAQARFLAWDALTDVPVVMPGSTGFRKLPEDTSGRWNLSLRDGDTGKPVLPHLTMSGLDRTVPVLFRDPLSGAPTVRSVPTREIVSKNGRRILATTVLDLLLAHYGVYGAPEDREGRGEATSSFEKAGWAEEYCGTDGSVLEEFALEWGEAARRSEGRCLALTGPDGLDDGAVSETIAAVSHALILTGCMGRQGGGFGRYSGQRKIIPFDSWSFLSSARDWVPARRTVAGSTPRVVLLWGLDPVPPVRVDPGLIPPLEGANDKEAARESVPDLVVDLSFRMDPNALAADVVLPAATWYERCDLNSAERPGSLQAVVPAVSPRGESRSEWQIFRRLAAGFSKLASVHFREPVLDPVEHAADLSGSDGETSPPTSQTRKSDPVLVERDYRDLARRFDSLGPDRPNPVFAPPPSSTTQKDEPAANCTEQPAVGAGDEGLTCPVDFSRDEAVCEAILHISSTTNGEAACRAFSLLERSTGLSLQSLSDPQRLSRITWSDLVGGPRRPLLSPLWSGMSCNRLYVPFTLNVEYGVPWRTLTGRQQLLAGVRLEPDVRERAQARSSPEAAGGNGREIRLRFRLVRDKWTFGSLFADRRNVAALFRGPTPVWIHPDDASEIDVRDNDWIELQVGDRLRRVRCVVSRTAPRGVAFGCDTAFPFSVPRARYPQAVSTSAPLSAEPARSGFLPLYRRLELILRGHGKGAPCSFEVVVRRSRHEEGAAL